MSDGIPFGHHALKARRLGIETLHEAHIFMRKDCPVCRSEGFASHNRVLVCHGEKSVVATLYQVAPDFLGIDEAGLSEWAWQALELAPGARVTVSHPAPLESMSQVRSKIYGHRMSAHAFDAIIADVEARRYSNIQLAAFITACASQALDHTEMRGLTAAMVNAGDTLSWDKKPIVDKHSVGGLPGNRTTPIVVAIVAAAGLTIPKTSSRAITSPSGTADMMETLAPVELDIQSMRRVVEQEGGCIVWGGAVRLSPTDDILIGVERVLDLDAEGQLVASILSKKIAAGSTHLVLDLPVGPTAKIRSHETARSLSHNLVRVAHEFGIEARAIVTDGTQPVGRGIGPALEARDVLSVLKGDANAPDDLREHALALAGNLLELGGIANGRMMAAEILGSGKAWAKFQRICEAQGGMHEPPMAPYTHAVNADRTGIVDRIDNRRLSKVAKLAGAPDDKAAGLEIHVRLGARVAEGEPVYTIHAQSPGELNYALGFARDNKDIVGIAIG